MEFWSKSPEKNRWLAQMCPCLVILYFWWEDWLGPGGCFVSHSNQMQSPWTYIFFTMPKIGQHNEADKFSFPPLCCIFRTKLWLKIFGKHITKHEWMQQKFKKWVLDKNVRWLRKWCFWTCWTVISFIRKALLYGNHNLSNMGEPTGMAMSKHA